MRSILDENPGRMVLLLSVLWGISIPIQTAMVKNQGDLFTVPLILVLAGIFGPSAGLIVLFVMSFYLTWVGRLFGGRGKAHELRSAFAWSSIPNVASLLLLSPAVLLFGSDLFTSNTPYIDAHPSLFFLYIVADFILTVWAIIMLVKCVSEAHRFSSWRGLLTVGSWPVLLGAVILGAFWVDK